LNPADYSIILIILTIATALVFDLINGFHDSANSIATVVSTQVLKPHTAVLWAAFFNFAAIFIFAPHVADTIAKIVKIEPNDSQFVWVIFSGLAGAILWNLFTWWLSLPTSSSHALIGGLSGAGIAYAGPDVLRYDLLLTTVEFIVISPLLGFIGGFLIMLANYWIFRNAVPMKITDFFKKAQLVSAALYSIGHGANDAQKTMGVIMALLVASGHLTTQDHLSLNNAKTMWIIISCNLCMSLGTAFGGWRIVKTMGMRITRLKPMGGFSAETSGAFSLFLATYFGIPVSTTHTITAAIIGVASVTTKFSNVKWGIAARIIWAWVLTMPAAGLVGAAIYTAGR